MHIATLGSGSSGNATYVESASGAILLDAGLSARRITLGLKAIGRNVHDLSAIFLTHEHRDHAAGVAVLAKQLKVPFYATPGTWQALGEMAPDQRCIDPGVPLQLEGIQVTAFEVPHDANQPVGFTVAAEGERFALLTDLGYVSEAVLRAVRGCQGFLWEANHDPSLLLHGPYPWALKQRILGDHGHLSNQQTAEALRQVVSDETMWVMLGHLSEKNNDPNRACQTARAALAASGWQADAAHLHVVPAHQPSALYAVGAPLRGYADAG